MILWHHSISRACIANSAISKDKRDKRDFWFIVLSSRKYVIEQRNKKKKMFQNLHLCNTDQNLTYFLS